MKARSVRKYSKSSDRAKGSYLKREPGKADLERLFEAEAILLRLKERFGLSEPGQEPAKPSDVHLPTDIFCSRLTVLESAVKYLKENKGLSLRKISRLVFRDERNVWQIYRKAKSKHPASFRVGKQGLMIPVVVFSAKEFSPLETVVSYMRNDLGLDYASIGRAIGKDERTVWTAYQRAGKKQEHAKR